MNIARLIEASFNQAVKALAMGTSRQALYRARERAYVKALIAHLQREFADEDIRVFAASQRGNAGEFGTNRLLFDIAICRIGTGASAQRKAEDHLFIAEALWQIDVDFSREWRSALYALNRLNCGAAADKLLIAASPAQGSARFLKSLQAAGAANNGTLYLALVPHPEDWDDDTGAPQVWRLAKDDWAAVM